MKKLIYLPPHVKKLIYVLPFLLLFPLAWWLAQRPYDRLYYKMGKSW